MTISEALVRVGPFLLRPCGAEDMAFVADLFTALDPDEPADPEIMRYRWENPPAQQRREAYVVERDGAAVGYVEQEHVPWEKLPRRYAWTFADLVPELRTPAHLAPLTSFVEERARADGAEVFATWARETDASALAFLESIGYVRERLGRGWELDLTANRERIASMADASCGRMRREGIAMLTLDRERDPDRHQKVWRALEEQMSDVPTTIPFVSPGYDYFRRWLIRPGQREDRIWIAKAGDEVAGISLLRYPPIRGNVSTAWTGVSRAFRGRGVARALKLETLVQAIALGIRLVRTGNDSQNAPILHLNEQMGYTPVPGWIQFLKPVEAS